MVNRLALAKSKIPNVQFVMTATVRTRMPLSLRRMWSGCAPGMLRRSIHTRGTMALQKMPVNRSRYTNLYLLSQHRRRFQTDKHVKMVPPALRDLDSGGYTRQHNVHGACYGRWEGAQAAVEVDLLYLPPEDGRVFNVATRIALLPFMWLARGELAFSWKWNRLMVDLPVRTVVHWRLIVTSMSRRIGAERTA
jgi:hypothetical protein